MTKYLLILLTYFISYVSSECGWFEQSSQPFALDYCFAFSDGDSAVSSMYSCYNNTQIKYEYFGDNGDCTGEPSLIDYFECEEPDCVCGVGEDCEILEYTIYENSNSECSGNVYTSGAQVLGECYPYDSDYAILSCTADYIGRTVYSSEGCSGSGTESDATPYAGSGLCTNWTCDQAMPISTLPSFVFVQ